MPDFPDWFRNWYPEILIQAHQKTVDPDAAVDWLHEQMAQADWQDRHTAIDQIGRNLRNLEASDTAEFPDSWHAIDQKQQNLILDFMSGTQALESDEQGELLEQAVAPLIHASKLQRPYSLWVWQVLLQCAGLAEENKVRHWVDADQQNLEAFEARYALWEELRLLPGTLSPPVEDAWHIIAQHQQPDQSATPKRKHPLYVIVPLLIGAALTFFGIRWFTTTEGAPVAFSDRIAVTPIGVNSKVNISDHTLKLEGTIRLVVSETDTLSFWDASVSITPGDYLIHASEDRWEVSVTSGQLKVETEIERMIFHPGDLLIREDQQWYKSRE